MLPLCILAFFSTVNGEHGEDRLFLLQRRASRRSGGGCAPGESFAAASPSKEAVAEVLDSVPADSANPWHTTICTRTKHVMDDLENAVNLQEEVCPGWADPPEKLLSFGCSVGLEMEEALYRFPTAQVVGYDLDPFVVQRAQQRLRHRAQVFSEYGALPAEGFDLVLANNLLYKDMSSADFVKLLKQLLKLLRRGGILELMVYSQQVRPLCPTGNWCEGFQFNASIAWQGIRELLPTVLSLQPERVCSAVAVPSVQGSTLFVYKRID